MAQSSIGFPDKTTGSTLTGAEVTEIKNVVNANGSDVEAHKADNTNPHSVDKADVGLPNAENTSDLSKPISTATQNALDLKSDTSHTHDYVPNSEKGASNGVATLDGSGKLPTGQLPGSVAGGLAFLGTWDASTNTPSLSDGSGSTSGEYYKVSVAGSTSLDGISSWAVGDWVLYNGTAWEKIDQTETVSSVSGKTGVVVLDKSDVGLSNVDNTSDLSKPISTLTQAEIDTKADAADLTSHTGDTANPHAVTKAQVGLSNVDNTADSAKPVSSATQSALDLKQNVLTSASQAEMEAGTEPELRAMSPLRVGQAISALGGGGGGGVTAEQLADLQALLALNFQLDMLARDVAGENVSGFLTDQYSDTALIDLANTTATHNAIDFVFRTTAPTIRSLLIQSETTDGSTTFTDSTTNYTVTPLGSAEHSTTESKFDLSSIKIPGSGSALEVADGGASDDLDLISGDFTIEAQVFTSELGADAMILQKGSTTTSNVQWRLFKLNTNQIRFQYSNNGTAYTDTITGTITLSANTWTHIAVVSSGGTITLYVDGVADGTTAAGTIADGTGSLRLGLSAENTLDWVGYFEEVSIVAGTAVYTEAFTPPTLPYSLTLTNFLLVTDAISASVAPSKITASVTIEDGGAYDTVVENTDVKCYLTQTGDEDPEDGGFAGIELTLVSIGTTASGFKEFQVKGDSLTGTSTTANKFIIHGPTGKDFRAHANTVILY